jgi:hypothetical protein
MARRWWMQSGASSAATPRSLRLVAMTEASPGEAPPSRKGRPALWAPERHSQAPADLCGIVIAGQSSNKLAADRNEFAAELSAALTVTSRLTGKLRL